MDTPGIIGVEEKEDWENDTDDRQIILPPLGVLARDLDRIQKQIMGACRENIRPEYFPIISPQVVEMEGTTKHLLVIWAMASDNRPHSCKESEKGQSRYYIRRATETRKASSDEERQLLTLHSKIPFDDRRAHTSGILLTVDFFLYRLVLKDTPQIYFCSIRRLIFSEQTQETFFNY